MGEQSVNQRIKILIEELGLKNPAGLVKALGYTSHHKIYRLIDDESTKPSIDIVNDILEAYKTVSPEWLISGRGPMFKISSDSFAHIGDRIGRICEVYNISIGEFADRTGQHPVYINEMINNDKVGINRDAFVRILEAFPEIHPLWMAYNEGPMRRQITNRSVEVDAKMGDTVTLTIHLK